MSNTTAVIDLYRNIILKYRFQPLKHDPSKRNEVNDHDGTQTNTHI